MAINPSFFLDDLAGMGSPQGPASWTCRVSTSLGSGGGSDLSLLGRDTPLPSLYIRLTAGRGWAFQLGAAGLLHTPSSSVALGQPFPTLVRENQPRDGGLGYRGRACN